MAPLDLHEEDRISDLFPEQGTLVWPSYRFEELELLILDERIRTKMRGAPVLSLAKVHFRFA